MSDWWKNAFQKAWYPLQSITFDWKERTDTEVQSLKKILMLPKASRILDVACGVGRHSVGLAKLGYQVTGIDISPSYLRSAKGFASKQGVKVRFICCDMRQLPFHEEFDGVINLFSSFGYFHRASDDEKVLKGILRAIVPNGIFAIDTVNINFVRRNFLPQAWLELSDGTLVLEKRYPIGPKSSIVKADWLFISNKGKRTRMVSSIRGYTPDGLGHLIRGAGFIKIRPHPPLVGKREGGGKYSSRVVISARKPPF